MNISCEGDEQSKLVRDKGGDKKDHQYYKKILNQTIEAQDLNLPALKIHESKTEGRARSCHISVDIFSLKYARALLLIRT